MKIPVNKIKVQPGRRAAKAKAVEELAQSMADIGMVNPITVDTDYRLVAGLHRLEAARLLGWTEVECSVLELDTLCAKLAEIDENLFRTSLNELELSELIAERKKIYEVFHPERRRGGDRRSLATISPNWRNGTVKSFAEDTAQILESSPRTIERHIQIAERLTPETKKILKKANVPITQQTMEKLTRLKHGQQEEAARLLSQGGIKTVEEYLTPPEQESSVSRGYTNATLYMEAFASAVFQIQHLIGVFQKKREILSGSMSVQQYGSLGNQAAQTVTALNDFIAGLNEQPVTGEARRIS